MRIFVLRGFGLHVLIPVIFSLCIPAGFVSLIGRKLNMKIYYSKDRLWLCLPVIVTCSLDVSLTLLGQPAEYWITSFRVVNEANPICHLLLTVHPLAFVLYNLCELLIVSVLIMALPVIVSKTISVFYTIGSAKAIYYWMAGSLHYSFFIANIVLIFPAIIMVCAFEKASEYNNPRQGS
jgi:hypothetical protein